MQSHLPPTFRSSARGGPSDKTARIRITINSGYHYTTVFGMAMVVEQSVVCNGLNGRRSFVDCANLQVEDYRLPSLSSPLTKKNMVVDLIGFGTGVHLWSDTTGRFMYFMDFRPLDLPHRPR